MRGLVPPGYKYLGPFNKLKRGRPTDDNDYAAYLHDHEYAKLAKDGALVPYTQYSQADERLIKKLKPDGWATHFAKNIFEAKKNLAEGGWISTHKGDTKMKSKELEFHSSEDKKKKKGQLKHAVPHSVIRQSSGNLRGAKVEPTIEPAGKRINKPISEISLDPAGNTIANVRDSRTFNHARFVSEEKTLNAMADVEMAGPTSGSVQSQTTAVSNFSNAYEGIPRQYTTILPYNSGIWTQVDLNNTTPASILYLRMSSIYDIIKTDGTTFSSDPAVAVDVADAATVEIPYWRDYWAQFWEYWTVVECRYKVRIWTTDESRDKELVVYHGYTGIQKIPLIDQHTTPTKLRDEDFRRFKGLKRQSKMINTTQDTNGTNDRHYESQITVKGVYHPGDGSHEVAEDELAQTWVKGNAVPKEQNLLAIIMTTSQRSGSQTAAVRYFIELEYIVQYKDPKALVQFPVRGAINGFYKSN